VVEFSLCKYELEHQEIISCRLETFSFSRLFSSMIFFRLVPPKLLVSMRGKQFSSSDSTSPNSSCNGFVSKKSVRVIYQVGNTQDVINFLIILRVTHLLQG
jgi:hypothetical protein